MSETPRPAAASATDLPPDLAALLAQVELAAVQRLAATKSFPPFALAMQADGNVVDYSASVPADQATPELIYNVLLKGLANGARQGRFRAVGICHPVVMKDSGHHAVRVLLEQAGGVAREAIAPYLLHSGGAKPTLQPATISTSKPAVFADHDF